MSLNCTFESANSGSLNNRLAALADSVIGGAMKEQAETRALQIAGGEIRSAVMRN